MLKVSQQDKIIQIQYEKLLQCNAVTKQTGNFFFANGDWAQIPLPVQTV